jgi:serine protease inhibitor
LKLINYTQNFWTCLFEEFKIQVNYCFNHKDHVTGVLDEVTRLVLVNAVYFKGLWEKQFSAASTAVEKFHLNSKESKDVPMMHKKDKFGYLQSQDLDADILQMHYQVSLRFVADIHTLDMLPSKSR